MDLLHYFFYLFYTKLCSLHVGIFFRAIVFHKKKRTIFFTKRKTPLNTEIRHFIEEEFLESATTKIRFINIFQELVDFFFVSDKLCENYDGYSNE